MVSNDVAALTPGQGCRAAFLDSTGHILADLYVHCLPDAAGGDGRTLSGPLQQTLEKYLIMEKVRTAGRVRRVGRSFPAGRGRGGPAPRRGPLRGSAAAAAAVLPGSTSGCPPRRRPPFGRRLAERGRCRWTRRRRRRCAWRPALPSGGTSWTRPCCCRRRAGRRRVLHQGLLHRPGDRRPDRGAGTHQPRPARHPAGPGGGGAERGATRSTCRKTRRRRAGRSDESPAPSPLPCSRAAPWRWPTSGGSTASRGRPSPFICGSRVARSSRSPARCGGRGSDRNAPVASQATEVAARQRAVGLRRCRSPSVRALRVCQSRRRTVRRSSVSSVARPIPNEITRNQVNYS